uniref:Uncharacterized protein n=1 Tax=Anopheles farauti TaxID=69004 RepID=A0A182QIA2_9DIPT
MHSGYDRDGHSNRGTSLEIGSLGSRRNFRLVLQSGTTGAFIMQRGAQNFRQNNFLQIFTDYMFRENANAPFVHRFIAGVASLVLAGQFITRNISTYDSYGFG